MEAETRIEWAGIRWYLDAERSAFMVNTKSLLIADFHLGKHTHFRKQGIALPPTAFRENLERLERQIQKYDPAELIFMGDLFHSSPNHELIAFLELMLRYPQMHWRLIPGNHDREQLKQLPLALELLPEQYLLGELCLMHQPPDKTESPFYCYGHVHPAYRLRSKAKSLLQFPCFAILGSHLILPAFSRFTGGHLLKKNDRNDKLWLCTPEGITKV
ncbi:MAG: ligase-associated DNA damage response endonuclease PdeM [Bacteroidia bacterium]